MPTWAALFAFVIFAALAGLGIGFLAAAKTTDEWHKEIIKHGAGQYNPTTGVFEWKEWKEGKP
jgi:hypothetical protein